MKMNLLAFEEALKSFYRIKNQLLPVHCHQLHHRKEHQHNVLDGCPVEKEIKEDLTIIEKYIIEGK